MLRAKPGYWYIIYLYTRLGRRRANSEISSSHGRCAVACEAAKITSRSYSWRGFTCGILIIYNNIIDEGRWKGATVVPPTSKLTYRHKHVRYTLLYTLILYTYSGDAFKHERLTVCYRPCGKDRAPTDALPVIRPFPLH